MQDRIKEHDRDIRLARTETSAVSEHAHNTGHKPLWNEVKFIDRDPYCYTRRVKEAINIRLHPNNIQTNKNLPFIIFITLIHCILETTRSTTDNKEVSNTFCI